MNNRALVVAEGVGTLTLDVVEQVIQPTVALEFTAALTSNEQGPSGQTGAPGPPGPPGVSEYDPGDLTVIFRNKLY